MLPHFRDQGQGVLINNASVYAHIGAPWLTAYVALYVNGVVTCVSPFAP